MQIKKVLLLLCLTWRCYAGIKEELFWRAGNLYAQKKYEEAYALYQSLTPKSEAIWHNMGACKSMLGDQITALVCWRNAQRGATTAQYDKLEGYIHEANEQLKMVPEFYWRRVFERILWRYPLLLFQCLFLIWLFVLSLVTFKNRYQKMGALFLAFVLGFLVYIKYSNETTYYVMVIHDNAMLLAGPGDQYQVIDHMNKGTERVIKQRDASWLKVYGQGKCGWCRQDDVAFITGN